MSALATAPHRKASAKAANASRHAPLGDLASAPTSTPIVAPLRALAKPSAGISRMSACTLIDLPKVQDPRGNLTFIEAGRHLPFKFNRVFYLYDVPGGSDRGGHALKTTHQFIVAISGSFDVVLDAGNGRQRFQLNRSYYGLYIAPMVWRELENFSSGSVALVLASAHYDEGDYIREHTDFKQVLRDA